jgi:hypothetical protein
MTATHAIEALFGSTKPEERVTRILSDFTRITGRFATAEDVEEIAVALEAMATQCRTLMRPIPSGDHDAIEHQKNHSGDAPCASAREPFCSKNETILPRRLASRLARRQRSWRGGESPPVLGFS